MHSIKHGIYKKSARKKKKKKNKNHDDGLYMEQLALTMDAWL
jgi:hypothetical protein